VTGLTQFAWALPGVNSLSGDRETLGPGLSLGPFGIGASRRFSKRPSYSQDVHGTEIWRGSNSPDWAFRRAWRPADLLVREESAGKLGKPRRAIDARIALAKDGVSFGALTIFDRPGEVDSREKSSLKWMPLIAPWH
jgi:hypothetical protein